MEYIQKFTNYITSYLSKDISNGKILMLSGEWGSGKTHLWKNKIQPELKNNIYISLYGKNSINDIENELFIKAYNKSINKDKTDENFIEKLASIFYNTPLFNKYVAGIKEYDDKLKKIKAESFINKDIVICFDDFERKSSNINLNDLFGLITNISLEFNAKIVIILNADEFRGNEKNIFSKVKEKSVSKYLFYKPDFSELFDLIFQNYSDLKEFKKEIKSTIRQINILNIRIFIQVLDNIQEWISYQGRDKEKVIDELKALILININFILNHYVYEITLVKIYDNNFSNVLGIKNKTIATYESLFKGLFDFDSTNRTNKYSYTIKNIKNGIKLPYNNDIIEAVKNVLGSSKQISYEHNIVKSIVYSYNYNLFTYSSLKNFQTINEFIETGLLD